MYRAVRTGTGTAVAGAGITTTLPMTGADLTALVVVGFLLVIAGFVLMRLRLQGTAAGR
ncbi:MAG TPA: LPXTG cell wall anchor domain-containing protein [Acidimicrobiales bacterium]|nr:LPXTG cell wall anchor domain-containing protein [Acidimicrobiales bacterium]